MMKVIAGVHAGNKHPYLWSVSPDMAYDIYDYAIVQDKEDLSLVKIVGSGIIANDFLLPFGQVNKKVVNIVKAEDIIPPKESEKW